MLKKLQLKRGIQNFTKRHQSVQKENQFELSINRADNRSIQDNQLSKNMSIQTIKYQVRMPKIIRNHQNFQGNFSQLKNLNMELSGRGIYKT